MQGQTTFAVQIDYRLLHGIIIYMVLYHFQKHFPMHYHLIVNNPLRQKRQVKYSFYKAGEILWFYGLYSVSHNQLAFCVEFSAPFIMTLRGIEACKFESFNIYQDQSLMWMNRSGKYLNTRELVLLFIFAFLALKI